MGLLNWLGFTQSDEQIAEAYLREDCDENYTPGSIRHYMIEEVTDDIERKTGVSLRDDQTVKIVQRIRDDYGYGPIQDFNMPGHVDETDDEEYQAERRAQVAERDQRNAQIAEEQRSGGLLG